MTDKEKTIKELKEALDNLDITNKYRLNLIRAIEYLQEEPVSEEQVKESAEIQHVKETCKENGNSLTQESVSDDLNTKLDKYIKDNFTIDKEQLDRFGIEEKDYMYSMDKSDLLALVEHFTNWQKTKEVSVSEDLEKIVEEIAEPTILNAYGTKELARRLRNTIYGTSVNEELEEVSKEWLRPQLDKSYINYGEGKMMELTRFDGYAMLDAIEFGAKWQKEQLIAKAVDGDITFDCYGDGDKTYGCIAHNSFCLEDFGLKDRDKVKIIVIKED